MSEERVVMSESLHKKMSKDFHSVHPVISKEIPYAQICLLAKYGQRHACSPNSVVDAFPITATTIKKNYLSWISNLFKLCFLLVVYFYDFMCMDM